MLEPDLLVTKFTIPPLRSALLHRSHLLEVLEQSRSVPLTLLSASAGFGKTTLLSAWASQSTRAVAWLMLDEQDNDPTRFWAYVIAALRKAGSPVGVPAEALLHSSQSSLLTGALTSLINELATQAQDTALILDDYHLIHEQAIHDSLQFVLDHLPPNLHLLLASRVDPAFPLARLRARGQVIEIREADLRLRGEEAARFLTQVMGLTLTEEEIGRLETRTEGWITGLQLAALSLRRHTNASAFLQAFTGSHRFILDYVQGEILEPLPEDQQRFLLYTSVLTRINAGVCQALTGELASQQMLEDLERANLFLIPIDEERCWYRFHTLFREVLLARLQATQPEQVPRLHREAALWYLHQGGLHEAIPHALATRDFVFVAELLEGCVEHLALQGELNTLLAWIKQLPAEVVHAHPRLATTYLLVFNMLFPFSQQEQEERVYLSQLQEGVELLLQNEDQAALPSSERDQLRKRMMILDAWRLAKKALSAGDMEQLSKVAEQMQYPELDDDALWQQHGLAPFAMAWRMAGNFPPLVSAIQKIRQRTQLTQKRDQEVHILWGLIAALIALGQLREAHDCCQDLQQLVNSLGVPVPLAAYPDLFQAQLAYAWNKLEGAQSAARKAIDRTASLRYMDILMGAYEVLVRVSIVQGDLTGAEQTLGEMEQVNQSADIPLFHPWIESLRVHLWLAQGNLACAVDWAEHTPYRQEVFVYSVYSREIAYLALVRISLAQQRYPQALQLLAALLSCAEQVSRVGSMVSILALQVATLQASGATPEALRVLPRLLTLAEPEGYTRVFLDAGSPMQQALQALLAMQQEAASPRLSAYAHTVLAAFASQPNPAMTGQNTPLVSPAQPRALSQATSPLLDPLTPREQEVLRWLAEGATNQEIAEHLVVSLATVKKHVGSLFLKLAAENRTHAVARARELSLL
ncbi:MAG: LuxR C-terminal-related transcriptional regulator [Ktedonobacteraceae bacterium]